VYATAAGLSGSGSVVRLTRDPATGALTQPNGAAGCVSQNGAGPCADGHALDGANGVATSLDGKSVYVASFFDDAVVRFSRNTTTGAITEPPTTAGCVSETGADVCVDGRGLDFANAVAVSPDGKSVYVASTDSNAVARFNRGPVAGGITQPAGNTGCVSDMGGLGCDLGRGLLGANLVAVSPDGTSVYVGSSSGNGAVAHFVRAP
jgi:sugar lactone lactonase YvrE